MNGLQALVKAPLNGVIGLINAAISGLNKIKLPSIDIPFFGTVGGWGFNIGKIPYLAKGGIIAVSYTHLDFIYTIVKMVSI